MQNKPTLNSQPNNGIKTNMLWHRRLGLSTFVVLIFLAISGFALNHSPGLKLNQINLSSDWLLSWYGFEVPAPEGFEVRESWFYNDGNKRLLVDGNSVAPCIAPLSAVAQTAESIFALCANGLILLTANGELVEQFRPVDGLPANAQSVATLDNKVYLVTDSATVEFDPESLTLSPVDMATMPETLIGSQLASAPLPKSLQKQLKEQASGPSISLETLMLDLHSGRFFGQFGVLFVDLIGLLVCILSITGLMAWIKRR